MRARWLCVGGYPGASASRERFGSMGKRACRSDRQLDSRLFFHKLCAGLFGGLAPADFGAAAERQGEPGLRVGVLRFAGWWGCGFWADAGGAVCGRCVLCCSMVLVRRLLRRGPSAFGGRLRERVRFRSSCLPGRPTLQGVRASSQGEVRAEAGHLSALARGTGLNKNEKAPEKLHWQQRINTVSRKFKLHEQNKSGCKN